LAERNIQMKYFKSWELVDRATYEFMGDLCMELLDPVALQALDDLREFFGVPIVVNDWYDEGHFEWRGYRTLKKAAELGYPQSQHAQGKAFDCDVAGLTAEEARKKILANQDNPLLLKITRLESGVSWVHFDVKKLAQGVKRIHLFKA
jgi:hypothetical protein